MVIFVAQKYLLVYNNLMKLLTNRLEIISMSKDMYIALKNKQHYKGIDCDCNWPPKLVMKIIEGDLKAYKKMDELLKWSVWIIINKETMEIIGDAGFKYVPDINGVVEIGYGINSKHQRNGYCFEAARALTDMALEDVRVEYVTAECLKDNTGSIKVLKKLGFEITHENNENYYWSTITDS